VGKATPNFAEMPAFVSPRAKHSKHSRSRGVSIFIAFFFPKRRAALANTS
jgi:hypothetical protein